MLPSDALNADHDLPAAQVRVTQEELTAALTALEARREEATRRREEEERYLAQTIPIGQAVKDLGLEATPEEVWAEVQAQRVNAQPLSPAPPQDDLADGYSATAGDQDRRWPHRPWQTYMAIGAVAAPVLGLAALIGLMHTTSHSLPFLPMPLVPLQGGVNTNPFNRISKTVDDDFFHKLRLCQGPNPTYHLMHVDLMQPNNDGLRPDETVYPTRAVPDGYSIYNDNLNGYLPYLMDEGLASGGVVLREASDPAFTNWQGSHVVTTRYDGTRYVRCWISPSDIPSLKQHHETAVYFCRTGPDVPASGSLVPVTVPLMCRAHGQLVSNFWLGGGYVMGAPNRFVLREGQTASLDRHAWENFPDMTLPAYVPPNWVRLPGALNDPITNPDTLGESQAMHEYSGFDASSVLQRAEDVPNGRVFHGGRLTLQTLASSSMPWGPSLSVLPCWVDVRPNLDCPYTFVKYDGNVYLRGWTAEHLTQQQIEGHTISIAASPDCPDFVHPPVRLQLRLDECDVISTPRASFGGQDRDRLLPVVASNVHFDKHAWEEW